MTAGTVAIRIRGVSHQFGEEGDARHVRALRDTSLDIARGELLCLIGPSGCGKSTLLNVVGGLMAPTTGHGGGLRQEGGRADAPRHRLCVPGERAVPVEHGVRERQPRHGVPGRAARGTRGARATLARSRRAQGLRAALSRPALRRHAPARGTGPRAQSRNRHSAHGRAVRRARRADPHDPRRGPLGAAVADRQDHRVRDPQPGRGHLSRRPGGGVFRAPRHDQGDHPRRRAASAQARFRDLGQVHRHPQ